MGRLKQMIVDNYYINMIGWLVRVRLKHAFLSDEKQINQKYKREFGKLPNLKSPETMNEKIQWLKLHDRKDFHTICADKYRVREYLAENFGDEYLIPLYFQTRDFRELVPEKMPEAPFVIKSNNGTGEVFIVRDKSKVDWKHMRARCRILLHRNFYYEGQEWQYKNIEPRIIVEKLLQDKNGKIPNDYKLHFFNGKLEFIYCSIDREGKNYRNNYDPDWNLLEFTWAVKKSEAADLRGPDIKPPATLEKMIEIGAGIAKNFSYVRVDFYDVDGQLYYGEITLHHGSGYDAFYPDKYDSIFGEKLKL